MAKIKGNTLTKVRWVVLVASSIVINGYISGWLYKPHLYGGKLKAIILPVLNCYACPGAFTSCPAGTLQHFMVIGFVPLATLGILLIFAGLVGRFLCGWFCPFGLVQELLAKIPVKKWKMPRWMNYGKYFFLVFTVFLIPYLISDTVFCKLCPMGALEGGIPQMLLKPELHHLAGFLYWTKITILAITILLAIFINRFFCRAVCPLGALMALFNKISILQIRVNPHRCTTCDICTGACPVDIGIYKNPSSPECIRCGLCTVCPTKAVYFTTIFSEKPAEIPKKVGVNM
ncbi:MAG: hypothetical protein DRJ64_05425 [Thermoprotei archaeon]|nr:MAG: hypothetical protein DRJ64_05425 [Thermoprotei archaeon]